MTQDTEDQAVNHLARQAASALGRLGGRAGTGASKRRSREHYQAAQKAGVESRRARRIQAAKQ